MSLVVTSDPVSAFESPKSSQTTASELTFGVRSAGLAELPTDARGSLAALVQAASAVGALISRAGAFGPDVVVTSSLVAWGGWYDVLEPSCTLRVRATGEDAVAVASAIAPSEGEVLITSSPGAARTIDLTFLDGHSVGDLSFLRRFWTAGRWASNGALTGFTPLRRREADGLRFVDIASSWEDADEPVSWLRVAARRVGVRVSMRTRLLAASTVGAPLPLDGAHSEFPIRPVARLARTRRACRSHSVHEHQRHTVRGYTGVAALSSFPVLDGAPLPGGSA